MNNNSNISPPLIPPSNKEILRTAVVLLLKSKHSILYDCCCCCYGTVVDSIQFDWLITKKQWALHEKKLIWIKLFEGSTPPSLLFEGMTPLLISWQMLSATEQGWARCSVMMSIERWEDSNYGSMSGPELTRADTIWSQYNTTYYSTPLLITSKY